MPLHNKIPSYIVHINTLVNFLSFSSIFFLPPFTIIFIFPTILLSLFKVRNHLMIDLSIERPWYLFFYTDSFLYDCGHYMEYVDYWVPDRRRKNEDELLCWLWWIFDCQRFIYWNEMHSLRAWRKDAIIYLWRRSRLFTRYRRWWTTLFSVF